MQQSLYVACRACSVYSLTLHRKFAKACQTSSDWAGTLCAWGQSGLPVTDSNWEKDSFREAIIKNKTKKINHLPAEASGLAPALTGIVLPSCWNQAICLPCCVNVLTL